MSLMKKIESIRQQPEHIRMRWVWGCVAVSMTVIFAVWIFSITALFKKESSQQTGTSDDMKNLQDQMQNMKDQISSLKDSGNQSAETGNEGTVNVQNENSAQSFTGENDSEIPQSNDYSNLQNDSTNNSANASTDLQNTQQ